MKNAILFTLFIVGALLASLCTATVVYLEGHPRGCLYSGITILMLFLWIAFQIHDDGDGGFSI